ncbi:hypothetical protein AC579_10083 [Pseudocercospora musae]|uniref:Uncharacterized protein n=1 Tax=Pseudocercospora musae TaxID=113226 RepID=A0A139IG31_9PEZI|nr:hypothetical protein AC579_10083 [Pseudocercospora musae]
MPYQGPGGYVPPPGYMQYQQQHNGQARPAQAYATQGHPQYVTAQQYNTQPSQSSYQTPQYQPQPISLPQAPYSPDPLQCYQQPPRPRQTPPQAAYHPQQRHPFPHPPAQTPQAPPRPAVPQPQWNHPLPQGYEASIHSHSGPPVRNTPHQPHQQRSHQVQQPQRPPSQSSQYRPPIPVDAGRLSPVYPQAQLHLPQQSMQQQQQQRPPAPAPAPAPAPPQPSQKPRPVSQRPDTQATRAPQVNRPTQASPLSYHASSRTAAVKGRVAQLQIPIQRAPSPDQIQYEEEDAMALASKRRRSNEGIALPACDTTPQPQSTANKPHVKQVSPRPQHHIPKAQPKRPPPSPAPLTDLRSSQVPSTPTPATPLNYHSILLSLSDEYTKAAYSMSCSLAGADVSVEALEKYQNLLATGMSCLDTVLKNYAIPDKRKEARVRLRLASLLFEETDNDWEAEDTLSKGIPVCERARLSDLKYAMQHLQARIVFQSGKHKAAMTMVDKFVVETEKLQYSHWIYAFRFLRVSFGLLVPDSQRETTAMVRNLTAIAEVASRDYHHAVEIVAATLEAIVHLKSRHADGIDLALRALAAARTYQLTPAMTSMPQIRALLDCVDLACTLGRFNYEMSQKKMIEMQENMDAITRDPHWSTDGALHVPLGVKRDIDMDAETGGIMRQTKDGEVTLHFSWLTKMQMYSFGFLLSGLAVTKKTAGNEQKAETFLGEGIKLSKLKLDLAPQSLSAVCIKYQSQLQLRIMCRLHVVFACCGRSDWEVATKGLEALRRDLAEFGAESDQHLTTLMAYLEALCKHGLGDLNSALLLYRGKTLAFVPETGAKPGATNVDPIKVLAAANSILIMRGSGRDDEADQLLESIEPFCVVVPNSSGNEHGSKAMEAAFFIMKATSSPSATDSAILTTKGCLHRAVVAAKAIGNSQLLCMVMNIMTDAFFHNIVGDQAEKSAKAGRTLALKSQDKLWTAVADGMYAETLERCGRFPEARVPIRNTTDKSASRFDFAGLWPLEWRSASDRTSHDMAYHAQFHTRLLQQVNEMNSRNLELQSLLAQKDDELTQVNARLQNAMTSGSVSGSGRRPSTSALQRQNADLKNELLSAETAAATAEDNLKTLAQKFAEIESDLRRQILDLQGDVRKRDDLLREVAESCEPSYRTESGYSSPAPGMTPTEQNELKRLRTAFASLQKQFQAEKKENARLRNFPVSSGEKMRHIEEDQDDEESVPLVKRERQSSMTAALQLRPVPPPSPPMLPLPDSSRREVRSATPADTIHLQHRPSQSQTVPLKRKSPSKSSASSHPPGSGKNGSRHVSVDPSVPVKRETPSKVLSRLPKSAKSKKSRDPCVGSPSSSESEDDDHENEDDEDNDAEDLNNDKDFTLKEESDTEDVPIKRPRLICTDFPVKDKFEFQAVTSHLADGDIEAFDSQEQLKDECDELWERIQRCYDAWEEAKGEAWEFEFEKAQYKPTLPPCVTTKLTSKTGRMSWYPGCEGKFACKKCVEEGKPCFTWNGEEFWLLPLREEDRKYPIKEGLEIRYWLNVE